MVVPDLVVVFGSFGVAVFTEVLGFDGGVGLLGTFAFFGMLGLVEVFGCFGTVGFDCAIGLVGVAFALFAWRAFNEAARACGDQASPR